MRRDYIQQKGYQVVEMWEPDWWSIYKTDASVKNHRRKNFPYRRPLSEERLMQGIIDGDSFVMFNVILRCLNSCSTTFPTFFSYSKILL